MFRVLVDASCSENGASIAAIAIRPSKPLEIVDERTVYFARPYSSTAAEVLAINLGLELGELLGQCEVVCDNVSAVAQYKKLGNVRLGNRKETRLAHTAARACYRVSRKS